MTWQTYIYNFVNFFEIYPLCKQFQQNISIKRFNWLSSRAFSYDLVHVRNFWLCWIYRRAIDLISQDVKISYILSFDIVVELF